MKFKVFSQCVTSYELKCIPILLCLQVDFANQESQMAFYRSMQASGQDIRDFYDVLSERRYV